MEPARIKLYGLFWVTKKRYLGQWAFAVLLLALALFVWTLRPQLDFSPHQSQLANKAPVPAFQYELERPRTVPPHLLQLLAFIDTIPWIVAGLGILLAIECFFVMRKLSAKEAAANAAIAKSETKPVEPTEAAATSPRTDETSTNSE